MPPIAVCNSGLGTESTQLCYNMGWLVHSPGSRGLEVPSCDNI